MCYLSAMLTISLIGYGTVGRALSLLLLGGNETFQLNIMDPDPNKKGVFLDLKHGARMHPHKHLHFNNNELVGSSDYIFFTAGTPTKHGASRLSTTTENIGLVREIFGNRKLKKSVRIIAISNPVDLITLAIQQVTGIPESQVVGTGTLLDSARLSYHLADLTKQPLEGVNGWVLGEHGESQFVSVSMSTIQNKPLSEQKHFRIETVNQAAELTRSAAFEIRKTEQGTSMAVSQCALELFHFFEKGTSPLIPLSVCLSGAYLNWLGIEGPLCISVPVRISKNGVELESLPNLPLQEYQLLKQSAEKLVRAYGTLK